MNLNDFMRRMRAGENVEIQPVIRSGVTYCSTTIQTGGFRCQIVKPRASIHFQVDQGAYPAHKEVVLKVYEAYIALREEATYIKNPLERMRSIEGTLRRYSTFFELVGELPELLDNSPQLYLESAKNLQAKIREIVSQNLFHNRKLSIVDNNFSTELDEAYRCTIRTFNILHTRWEKSCVK